MQKIIALTALFSLVAFPAAATTPTPAAQINANVLRTQQEVVGTHQVQQGRRQSDVIQRYLQSGQQRRQAVSEKAKGDSDNPPNQP